MASFFDHIPQKQKAFIAEQKMFFVATAPETGGRVNLSPKGLDSFHILDDNTVAYMDLTGSGNESAAHTLQNGRITVMFCGFEKQPMILRLYGTGRVVNTRSPEWEELAGHFELLAGARQIMVIKVSSVQTSCGFGVPYYTFNGERPTLVAYTEKAGDEKMIAYRAEKNVQSIDGLPTPPLD